MELWHLLQTNDLNIVRKLAILHV